MNKMMTFLEFLNEAKVTLRDYESVIDDHWFKDFKAGFECEFLLPNLEKDLSFEKIAQMYQEWTGDSKVTFSLKYHDDDKKMIDPMKGQLYSHIEPDITILKDPDPQESEKYYSKQMKPDDYQHLFAVEIASKTLGSVKEFLEYLESTFNFINQHKGITNSSTGFHFTISGFPKETNWYRVAYLAGTNSILKQFNRAENENSKSQLSSIDQSKIVSGLKTGKPLSKVIDQDFSLERKFDIHLKGKLMEFRSIGNWLYHQKFSEIKLIFLRMLYSIKKANTTDPQDFAKTEVRKMLVQNSEKDIPEGDDKKLIEHFLNDDFKIISDKKAKEPDEFQVNRNKIVNYLLANSKGQSLKNLREWIYNNSDRLKNLIKILEISLVRNKEIKNKSIIEKYLEDFKTISSQNIWKDNSFATLMARQSKVKNLLDVDKKIMKISLR